MVVVDEDVVVEEVDEVDVEDEVVVITVVVVDEVVDEVDVVVDVVVDEEVVVVVSDIHLYFSADVHNPEFISSSRQQTSPPEQ